jgi:hypothetical protein
MPKIEGAGDSYSGIEIVRILIRRSWIRSARKERGVQTALEVDLLLQNLINERPEPGKPLPSSHKHMDSQEESGICL